MFTFKYGAKFCELHFVKFGYCTKFCEFSQNHIL